ncbi:MAG: NUDIX domain-containing protein [Parafilimonas sp.]
MIKQVCSGGLLVKHNRFLFGKRSKNKLWAPGVWDIVGGKALKNEHPLYTLKREIYEETKVVVLNAELITSLNIYDESISEDFTYHIYMVTHWKNKAVNNSKEHSKLRWFKRKRLDNLQLALPEYLKLIDRWLILNQSLNKS